MANAPSLVPLLRRQQFGRHFLLELLEPLKKGMKMMILLGNLLEVEAPLDEIGLTFSLEHLLTRLSLRW